MKIQIGLDFKNVNPALTILKSASVKFQNRIVKRMAPLAFLRDDCYGTGRKSCYQRRE
jgi:hypothetical protein